MLIREYLVVGALPARNSRMLVPTGRARVLIREYHGTGIPNTVLFRNTNMIFIGRNPGPRYLVARREKNYTLGTSFQDIWE